MLNCITFFFSGKLFTSRLILHESLAGYSNLDCKLLHFITFQYFLSVPLAFSFTAERSPDSLMRAPLYIGNCFSLAGFNTHSVCLPFGGFIMVCLGVVLFGFILFGTHCVSYACVPLDRLGKISVIIYSNMFSIAFSLSLLSFG